MVVVCLQKGIQMIPIKLVTFQSSITEDNKMLDTTKGTTSPMLCYLLVHLLWAVLLGFCLVGFLNSFNCKASLEDVLFPQEGKC